MNKIRPLIFFLLISFATYSQENKISALINKIITSETMDTSIISELKADSNFVHHCFFKKESGDSGLGFEVDIFKPKKILSGESTDSLEINFIHFLREKRDHLPSVAFFYSATKVKEARQKFNELDEKFTKITKNRAYDTDGQQYNPDMIYYNPIGNEGRTMCLQIMPENQETTPDWAVIVSFSPR